MQLNFRAKPLRGEYTNTHADADVEREIENKTRT